MPIRHAPAAPGWARSAASARSASLLADKRNEAALVRHVHRIESQHLACAPNHGVDRNRPLVETDGDIRGLCDLDHGAGEPAARQVPQAMDIHSRRQQRSHRAVERSRIAEDVRLECESFSRRHDGDAVPADVAGQEHGVPGTDARGDNLERMLDEANARGVDEDPVAFSVVDDLRITRHDLRARGPSRRPHRVEHRAQRLDREALLENEGRAQPGRPRPGHREIVHGAVDRERADVAAREEGRADHIGVGREGDPNAPDLENRGVVTRVQMAIAERGNDQPLEKLVHQPSASAMGELNRGREGIGNRTRRRELLAHRPISAGAERR